MIYIGVDSGVGVLIDDLYLNKEVSLITGLRPRQVISWTEKGLVEPKRPARKAGTMRGYSYINLLEFGLAKYLIDVISLQFYTVRTILRELREDGEVEAWASDYFQRSKSFARKTRDERKDELVGYHMRVKENGTARKKPVGTLYYIFTEQETQKEVGPKYIETIRIISPYDLTATLQMFHDSDALEDILSSKGMIIVNMGKIKREIDSGIKALS